MTRRPDAPRPDRTVCLRGRRAGGAAAPLLAVIMVIGGAAVARTWYATLQHTRAEHASDSATILALEGVNAFTRAADPQALMTLPVGADSMVMKARVFRGDRSIGTYAVSLKRVATGGFRLLATGRLVADERSTICSVRGRVRLADEASGAISVGYDAVPLCNGEQHRSALTTQLGS